MLFCVCTPSAVMTVLVWVFVWRMITYLPLEHGLHDFVVPSANATLLLPLSTQSLSCCTVCGVSACVQLAAWQPPGVVTTGFVAVVLLTSTPLLKTSVRAVWMFSCLIACSFGWQPQVTVPPGLPIPKSTLLLPWQISCSEFDEMGVTVVDEEPDPSSVTV